MNKHHAGKRTYDLPGRILRIIRIERPSILAAPVKTEELVDYARPKDKCRVTGGYGYVRPPGKILQDLLRIDTSTQTAPCQLQIAEKHRTHIDSMN